MTTDFHDAHARHWDDAERLYGVGRWANADHLYGFAAECGLKRLMLAFGMPYDTTKDMPADRADATHVDGLWTRYESYRSGHASGTDYGLPAAGPFSDWKASQRYVHQSGFNQALVDSHRAGAEEVNKLIRKAELAGLI